jgi:hypothetical protein
MKDPHWQNIGAWTDRWVHRQTEEQADIWEYQQTDAHIERRTDGQAEKEKD